MRAIFKYGSILFLGSHGPLIIYNAFQSNTV